MPTTTRARALAALLLLIAFVVIALLARRDRPISSSVAEVHEGTPQALDGREQETGRRQAAPRGDVEPVPSASPEGDETRPGDLAVDVVFAQGNTPATPMAVYLIEPWTIVPIPEWTDQGGRAVFRGLVPGKKWVEGDRGGHVEVDVLPGKWTEVQLRIPPGASVTVHVEDELHSSIVGAEILVSSQQGKRDGEGIGRTDETGDYRLLSAEPGRLVWAAAEGFEPSHAIPLFQQLDGAVVPLVLRKGEDCVRGIVVDAVTGQPLDRAIVRIAGQSWPTTAEIDGHSYLLSPAPPAKAVTGSDGSFLCCSVPSHPTTVEVMRAGYVGFSSEWSAQRWCEIALQPATRVVGVVELPGGEPVPGAVIRIALPGRRDVEAERLRTTSDQAGRFVLSNVPPGLHELRATHGPGSEGTATVQAALGVPAEVEIVLNSVSAVRIEAADSAGRPLRGCCVGLLGEAGEERGGYVRFSSLGITDEDGRLLVMPELLEEGDGRVALLLEACSQMFPIAVEEWEEGTTALRLVVEEEYPYSGGLDLVLHCARPDERSRRSVFVRDERLGEWAGVSLRAGSMEHVGGLRPGTYTCVTAGEEGERSLGQYEVVVGRTTRVEFWLEDIDTLPESSALTRSR